MFRALIRWRPASWGVVLALLAVAMPARAMPARAGGTAHVARTPEQEQFVREHPVWRVSGDPSWRPYCFRGPDGRLAGLDIELTKVLAERIGVHLEWVDVPSWPEALRRFRNGEVDLLMSTAKTPERDREMLFTDSYAASPVAVITRNEAAFLVTLGELRNKTIAAPEAHVTTEYLRRYPEPLRLVVYPHLEDAVRAVSSGEADAVVAGLIPAATSIQTLNLQNLKVAGLVDVRFDLRVAVRRDWPEARDLLDLAIAQDPPELRIERFDRWLQPILGLQRQALAWRSASYWAIACALALTLLIAFVGAWNQALKARVARATLGIQREMAARAESELRFRTMFEKAPIGVSRSTLDGLLLSVNPCLAGMCEYADPAQMVAEVNPRGMATLFEDPAQHAEVLDAALADTGCLVVRRVRHRTRTGRSFDALVSVTTLTDPVDGAVTLLAFVQDISKHVREEANRAQREKVIALGEMASGVAHDFNNLLCVLSGEVSLISEGLPKDPVISEALERMDAALLTAQDLTNRLLGFLRTRTGDQCGPFDAHAAIHAALDLFNATTSRNVRVRQNLGATVTRINGFEGELRNVLLNLFLNARDAMKASGELAITTRNLANPGAGPAQWLEIRVADQGSGMTPEVLAACRAPFFSTKGDRGTGIGLWTASSVVADLGGSLEIESALGEGTTVSLRLPALG
jgi:two-component system sensor histidine kinase/response regulator